MKTFKNIALVAIIISSFACNEVKNFETLNNTQDNEEGSLHPIEQIMGNDQPLFLIKEIYGDRPRGAKAGGEKPVLGGSIVDVHGNPIESDEQDKE